MSQADLYRRALEQAEKLVAELRLGRDGSQPLQALLALFKEISALEASLQPKALRPAMAQIADLREKLHQQIQLAEQEAVSQRDQIAPQLDQVLRVRRMQRAYNQWR